MIVQEILNKNSELIIPTIYCFLIYVYRAQQLKCNNAPYPDLYGHYREAKFTQTKHHWWWKANRIFNQLDVTRNYTGLVIFLEEDHYIVEDFISVLRLMERTCDSSCKECNIISLGTYLKTYNYYGDSRKVNHFFMYFIFVSMNSKM